MSNRKNLSRVGTASRNSAIQKMHENRGFTFGSQAWNPAKVKASPSPPPGRTCACGADRKSFHTLSEFNEHRTLCEQ